MDERAAIQRIPDKDLVFLRRYAAQWLNGGRRSWVAHNRATGVGVIIAALGCLYGLGWRGWSALDAALLLYVDMVLALLADLLKYRLAGPAVRRALALDADEQHCWALLLDARFRGVIEGEDIRRAQRVRLLPIRPVDAFSSDQSSGGESQSLGCLYALSVLGIALFGVGLWYSLQGSWSAESLLLSDPVFMIWLALAGAWRLGDGLVLIQANRREGDRLDLLPGAGVGPGLLLIVLPVFAIAAVLSLPDQIEVFWLSVMVAYVFAALLMGLFLMVMGWQRERWLRAFVYADQEGRIGRLGEVLVYRATGTAEPVSEGKPGSAADQTARSAYALMIERPDWVNAAIRSDTRVHRVLWFTLAAAAWVFVACALAIVLIWSPPWAWLGSAGLALMALACTGVWLYGHLQERRFGTPLLLLDRTPLRLGERFSARLVAAVPARGAAGHFELRLTCTHRQQVSGTGGSKGSPRKDTVLWEARWQQGVERDGEGRVAGAILQRDLPETLPESRYQSGTGYIDRVDWQLHVRCACAGPDFRARFELPVFHLDTGIDAVGSPDTTPALNR